MPDQELPIEDRRYMDIGRLHGSEDVATECSEASARWGRDVTVLAAYGYGAQARAAFEAMRDEHAEARAARPEAVAAKVLAVKKRDEDRRRGWTWVDKTTSILEQLALSDPQLAVELRAAAPDEDDELPGAIPALARLLEQHKAKLPPEVQADQRLAEAPGLHEVLEQAPGKVSTAKAVSVADTADLDLLDGRLYVVMRGLNRAGRKAIRNGELDAQLSEYRFNHLNRSGSGAGDSDDDSDDGSDNDSGSDDHATTAADQPDTPVTPTATAPTGDTQAPATPTTGTNTPA